MSGTEDFAALLPTDSPGVLTRTLELVRFGEAVDDYRYLQALQSAIDQSQNRATSDAAQAWLDGLMNEITVDHRRLNPAPMDDRALDDLRDQASAWIERL